jgi:hypothetical protein
MPTTIEKNIYDYTDQKLKAHHQNNMEFNFELANAYEYYKAKLFEIVNPSDQERVANELFQSVKSQIFNGYFLVQELLGHETTQIEDDWFKQSIGMIAQQIPDMLRDITDNNIDEIITFKPLKEMASWLVIEYEGVYPLLMDISLNIACLGAKWAFIDEAAKREITPYNPNLGGLLANVDDVVFINPQNYLTCDIKTESTEFWTVLNSKYNEIDKIGEVTIIKHQGNDGSDIYSMNLNIKNSLSLIEQQSLIDTLGVKLMDSSEIKREHLSLTGSSVEEFYYINNPIA